VLKLQYSLHVYRFGSYCALFFFSQHLEERNELANVYFILYLPENKARKAISVEGV